MHLSDTPLPATAYVAATPVAAVEPTLSCSLPPLQNWLSRPSRAASGLWGIYHCTPTSATGSLNVTDCEVCAPATHMAKCPLSLSGYPQPRLANGRMRMTMGRMTLIASALALTSDVDGHRLSPRICVTIEARQKRMIEKQCAREHRTMSEVTRLALRLYYEGKDEFGRPNLTNQPTS